MPDVAICISHMQAKIIILQGRPEGQFIGYWKSVWPVFARMQAVQVVNTEPNTLSSDIIQYLVFIIIMY